MPRLRFAAGASVTRPWLSASRRSARGLARGYKFAAKQLTDERPVISIESLLGVADLLAKPVSTRERNL
jgi:hypothetical protein